MIRLTDDLLQPQAKKRRRTLADLMADIRDLVWPPKPIVFYPPPPDLTLLFRPQARAAGFSEPVIAGVLGYYRAIAPDLGIEQLHQLALLFNDEFEAGEMAERERYQQQGE